MAVARMTPEAVARIGKPCSCGHVCPLHQVRHITTLAGNCVCEPCCREAWDAWVQVRGEGWE